MKTKRIVVFVYGIPNSYMEYKNSKYFKRNLTLRNMYVTYDMEDSHMKIYFTCETSISHVELDIFDMKYSFEMYKYGPCNIFMRLIEAYQARTELSLSFAFN